MKLPWTSTLTPTLINIEDEVIWQSSDTNVATVNDDGVVTAVAGGTAIIKASAGEYYAECTVNVIDTFVPITSIQLSEYNGILYVGERRQIIASLNEGANETIVWSSSRPDLVSVTSSADGKTATLNALAQGKDILITASSESGSIYANYIVERIDEKVEFIITNDTGMIEDDGISRAEPINVKELLEKQYHGINMSDKKIVRIDVAIEYTSKTGSVQSINCELKHNENKYLQKVKMEGKETYGMLEVSFVNLNINPRDELVVSNSVSKLTNAKIDISSNRIYIFFED